MALDGLSLDGAGGIVTDDLPASLGMTAKSLELLEDELEVILENDQTDARNLRFKIANILVTYLTHDERMCALHLFYGAKVSPCSGRDLCRLEKRVRRKLKALPEAELQALWHLL